MVEYPGVRTGVAWIKSPDGRLLAGPAYGLRERSDGRFIRRLLPPQVALEEISDPMIRWEISDVREMTERIHSTTRIILDRTAQWGLERQKRVALVH